MRAAWGILILLSLAGAGCGASADSGQTLAGNGAAHGATPTFLSVGRAADCPGRCLAETERIARGVLGLDPTDTGRGVIGDAQALRSLLEEECGAGSAAIHSLPVSDILDQLVAGPIQPVILAHEGGHVCVLVGAIDVDGELMFQLMHGQMATSLVTADQIAGAGFVEGWRLENGDNGVPIQVGDGRLRVSEILHNFGEVKPQDKLEHAFELINEGDKTLVMGKPTMSCTCTTSGVESGLQLQPGETRRFEVTMQSSNAASQTNSIVLPFFEQRSGDPKHVELLLVASRRQLMRVAPSELDFGLVLPGESYSRTVRLSEVPTDRFALQSVDVGELPLSYEKSETTSANGLRTYRVRLDLVVADDQSGPCQSTVRLLTDSRFQPDVTIPVRYEVPPPVQAMPSVISLGTVEVGEVREERVRIVSRDSDRLDIQIESAPDGCSVEIVEGSKPAELLVTITLREPGVAQGTIRCKAILDTRMVPIEIKYIAYVRARS